MIITVIAYKENAVDTCRGCVMDRYNSGLDMISSDDPEKIIEFVSALTAEDSYNSWDFTYFVNGRCIHYDNQYVREDFKEWEDTPEKHEKLINSIRTEAATWAAKFRADRIEAAAQKAVEEARKIEWARIANEKAELARLQLKYGDTTYSTRLK